MPSERWAEQAVVYQIYPLSWQDSNGDGKGDLEGIIQRLDYLNDGTESSLGVDAVWISPLYVSPMADFGYDVADYRAIDAVFGDMGAFDRLVDEVHKRGMRLIMDFVPNHTSIRHPWFVESRSSRTNPKRDWYVWRDSKPDGSPPNNWLSPFGSSAWEWDAHTGHYYMHTFLPQQADLNWRNPEVKAAMAEVLTFWLKRGVDGFRTDALYHLVKDDQWRDDPPNPNYVPGKANPYDALLHVYSQRRPELYATTASLCQVLDAHGSAFMVSEAYIDIPEMTNMYHACAHGVHAPFNFSLLSLPWEAAAYKRAIDEFETSLDPDDVPNYVLGNHDVPRVASRVGAERARLLAMLLFTLRGMAFVYYGEELGMENVPVPPDRVQDPLGRRVPGFGRDGERTSMQWDETKYAGFSTAKPWLPVGRNSHERNVAVESREPRSMLNLYRWLIHYRKKSATLLHGGYVPMDCGNPTVFGFGRSLGNERLVVVLNFSDAEQVVRLPFAKGKCMCHSHLAKKFGETVHTRHLSLRPYEGYVMAVE